MRSNEKEMFSNKFPNKLPFNSKKLNKEEITNFNQQMIVESEWFIDRLEMCIRLVNCEKKLIGNPVHHVPIFILIQLF
ncbi:hypothetical protein RhiirA5_433527 [Rhizophagus irregularis]|uniref:Uncharacterized protein n=1 Tax=Rhizophagus irregularis TaxID=588596 RepID=A0A2N0NRL7_9GLOM|nr:hypothetical protein RhiirA5_433527 [Rhizophagus irregularis]